MAEAVSYLARADEFAFQQSSPHSLREPFSSPPAPPLNLDANNNSNGIRCTSEAVEHAIIDSYGASGEVEDRRISTISSVSSFPTSVVHHEPVEELRTPSRSPKPVSARNESIRAFDSVITPSRRRDYASGFRNPSSVRAMQMKDELGDDSDGVTPHRRSGSQYSVRSHGSHHSAHTSPSKRISRSSQSSPVKNGSKLKKEFPLVLLHCSLLPASTGILSSSCDAELFGVLLPDEYRKRWAALQERVAMAELNARGILIPHPQEDYELLEERLLESLELEKSRIRSNHFLHQDQAAVDSGFESASQTDEDMDDDIPHGFQCPDCGKGINAKQDRKWEIKVYAANGLMRAGAWTAAWREMEKVDVEIGIWMPDDVRQEIGARLEAIKASEGVAEQPPAADQDCQDLREREIYGTGQHNSHHSFHPSSFEEPRGSPVRTTDHQPHDNVNGPTMRHQLEFTFASLFQDRRNLAIIMLGIVLMYLITGSNNTGPVTDPNPSKLSTSTEISTSTITSTAVVTATNTVFREDQNATSSLSDLFTMYTKSPEVSNTLLDEVPESPSLAQEPIRDQDED